MKPRLLNLAAAVSLLLAVAIVVLWVRSHGRNEVIYRVWRTSTEQRSWQVRSRYSALDFVARCESRPEPSAWPDLRI